MRASMILFARASRRAAQAVGLLLAGAAQAAVPGIGGAAGAPAFDLVAAPGYVTQPDGTSIYSWGYGCNSTAGNTFLPANVPNAKCPSGQMQLPGPTLIVHQGDTVTVKLKNSLPAAAGNTSILFPGFDVSTAVASPGVAGLLTREAAIGGSVTYTFVAGTPGTHVYYSGTRGDLQVEMGLYGALIVLPAGSSGTPLNGAVPSGYVPPTAAQRLPNSCRAVSALAPNGHKDFRLAAAAYNHPSACYDREYLFQFSEIDPGIHRQAEAQRNLACSKPTGCMLVLTEPYVPAYFMVNGRSMPDLMDPNYAPQYPNQPYNGNPHIHPGELMLLRIAGTGRWQHPFHEHGNHVRVLARDGNLLLSPGGKLAGPLLFTTTTTPGQTLDGIFQWTGKGLNWDVYAHTAGYDAPCIPDANGYHTRMVGVGSTASYTDANYFEWCGDHGKALEAKPFGAVGGGGPITLPDANLLANGPWYGGSPYLGAEATARAVGATPIPPSGTVANSQASFAYMWHSHNEREITTNNAFPGGMMMMMLVDHWLNEINEAN